MEAKRERQTLSVSSTFTLLQTLIVRCAIKKFSFQFPKRMKTCAFELWAGNHVYNRGVDAVEHKEVSQIWVHMIHYWITISFWSGAPVHGDCVNRHWKCTQPKWQHVDRHVESRPCLKPVHFWTRLNPAEALRFKRVSLRRRHHLALSNSFSICLYCCRIIWWTWSRSASGRSISACESLEKQHFA